MRAGASVYRWKQKFFLHPMYVRGPLMVGAEPVVSLAEDVQDGELGRALREVLSASARRRQEPSASEAAKILRALGGKSWNAVERGAHSLDIALNETEMRMTPLAYWEDKEEHERGLRGEKVVIASLSLADEAIGRKLRELTAT